MSERIRKHYRATETTKPEAAQNLPALLTTPAPDQHSPVTPESNSAAAASAASTEQQSAAHASHSIARIALQSIQRAVASPPPPAQPGGGPLRSVVADALASGSQPLDGPTQARVGPQLGHDFSQIRVHTDARAARAAQALHADAFTVGRAIVFARGKYQPATQAGMHLVAHELTHAVQQSRGPVSNRPYADGVAVSSPDDSFEQEAERTASQIDQGAGGALGHPLAPVSPAASGSLQRQVAGYRSPALQMRAQLRVASGPQLVVQRAVATSGGIWDTDQYDLAQDKDGSGNPTPPARGVRGLDITLRFKPGAQVDAELIGLTQSVQAFVNNAPNLTPAAATRAISSADATAINTGPGETDEGTAIDRAATYNNPIYPVQSTPSASLDDTNTSPGWGQNGFHFTDASGTLKQKDALLIDKPRRGNASKDSRHIFETTALATKGAQSGTYYGSVRWGWRTDSSGTFSKLPLTKVSDGVPSSTFMKAGAIWNAGKSSTGDKNVALPLVDVKVTTGPVTLMPPVPLANIALPVGTRLQIITEWHPPLLNGTVKVVDGPHTGVVGDVNNAEWGNIADERA